MRKLIFATIILATTALLVSFYYPAEAEGFPSVEATPFLLEKVKADEWLLIDVRTPEEYKQGHIPGAINMPHNEINGFVEQLNDAKNKPIIIYCRTGRRATIAMQMLEQKQFLRVTHLEGDMMGWTEAGLPVDKM